MAFVASIASVTRFAGVTLIMTGGILLLLDTRLDGLKKIKHILYTYILYKCILTEQLYII